MNAVENRRTRHTARTVRLAMLVGILVISTAIAVFLGVIGGSTAAGQFAWIQPTLAGEVEEAAHAGQSLDTSTIKGSTSMQEITDPTGIPAQELQSTFGLSAEQMRLPLKEAKAVLGFMMEDVRGYVATRLQQVSP